MPNFITYFINGFLYFMGLKNNPIEDVLQEYRKKSDAERLSNDWYKIGNDMRKAYETGKENIC